MTPTNQFPRDYDGIKRQVADANKATFDEMEARLRAEIDQQRARADRAEAACGEMRRLIVLIECKCDTASLGGYICPRCHALSLDAGKDFVQRQQAERSVWICEHCGTVEIGEDETGVGVSPVCQKCAPAEYELVRPSVFAEKASELEARNKRLETVLNDRQNCSECGGKGVTYTEVDGEMEAEPCECWQQAHDLLEELSKSKDGA